MLKLIYNVNIGLIRVDPIIFWIIIGLGLGSKKWSDKIIGPSSSLVQPSPTRPLNTPSYTCTKISSCRIAVISGVESFHWHGTNISAILLCNYCNPTLLAGASSKTWNKESAEEQQEQENEQQHWQGGVCHWCFRLHSFMDSEVPPSTWLHCQGHCSWPKSVLPLLSYLSPWIHQYSLLVIPVKWVLIKWRYQWLVYLVQVIPKRLTTCLNLMVQQRGRTCLRQISWKKVPLTLLLRDVMVSSMLLPLFLLGLSTTHRFIPFNFCWYIIEYVLPVAKGILFFFYTIFSLKTLDYVCF